MRNSPILFVLIGLMVLLDFYVFQAVKFLSQGAAPKTRSIIFITYWSVSILVLIIFIILPFLNLDNYSKGLRSVFFVVILALFFSKLIVSVFLLVDDIRRVIQWLAGKVFFRNTEAETLQDENKISRSMFLSWFGFAAGSGLFGSLLYGFTNKYDYQLKNIKLSFNNLPASFKGLKIVQISDIHSGSFNNKAAVEKGVEMINAQKPDLILFTGDLVNNRSDEMDDYLQVFNKLSAPMGVFSILGNHDYGDYESWKTKEEKIKNFERLKQLHSEMGWRLLLDENVALEKGGEQIALIGVENWSAKSNFPKYGNLKKAYAGSENFPFKILMSHDPTHWDAQVRPHFSDIDLTLAGHTHGMQFGVELPWFKWSPVQYVYRQWAGLYKEEEQYLYINRGYGFIGYPGRVGILPEITVLELA